MMRIGSAIQTKGFGFWLVLAMKRLMAAWRSTIGVEDAAFEATSRELGEEAFDRVDPGGRGRREVEGEAGMALEPGHDLGVLVRAVIVQDHMHHFARWHLGFDGIEGSG